MRVYSVWLLLGEIALQLRVRTGARRVVGWMVVDWQASGSLAARFVVTSRFTCVLFSSRLDQDEDFIPFRDVSLVKVEVRNNDAKMPSTIDNPDPHGSRSHVPPGGATSCQTEPSPPHITATLSSRAGTIVCAPEVRLHPPWRGTVRVAPDPHK